MTTATKPTAGKRPPKGFERIRAAARAVAAKGQNVTRYTVQRELTRGGRPGASFRDITEVVRAVRAEMLQLVSGRVEQAVAAVLALETDLERDALREAVQLRTGGGIRLKFTVGTRWTGGGRPGNVRLRAAQAAGGGHAPR